MDADVFVQSVTTREEIPVGALPALSTPRIIIRDGTDYWVPVAMLKYQLADATDQNVIDGCNQVADQFEQLLAAGNVLVAVREGPVRFFLGEGASIDQATEPPPGKKITE